MFGWPYTKAERAIKMGGVPPQRALEAEQVVLCESKNGGQGFFWGPPQALEDERIVMVRPLQDEYSEPVGSLFVCRANVAAVYRALGLPRYPWPTVREPNCDKEWAWCPVDGSIPRSVSAPPEEDRMLPKGIPARERNPVDLSNKDYFRLPEVAAARGCSVDDLVHHAAHGHITLGIAVFDELLYGVNAELQTVGVYHVTGVITIPEECAKRWEKGSDESYLACGFGIDPAYPPALEDASYMAEDSLTPPVFRWVAGRTWDNSETDLSLIERLMKGRTDTGLSVLKSNVVIHTVERARIERENAAATPRGAARDTGPVDAPKRTAIATQKHQENAKAWRKALEDFVNEIKRLKDAQNLSWPCPPPGKRYSLCIPCSKEQFREEFARYYPNLKKIPAADTLVNELPAFGARLKQGRTSRRISPLAKLLAVQKEG